MTNWKVFLLADPQSGQIGINRPVPIGWAPYTPSASNPIEAGDTIDVTCGFGNYTYPAASTYYNLHVAAGSIADLPALEKRIDDNASGDRLINITTAGTPAGNDYCVDAVSNTIQLKRAGSTITVINNWKFTYQPGSKATSPWGLAFSFGDPHVEATGDLS